jgi:hypothetical protein
VEKSEKMTIPLFAALFCCALLLVSANDSHQHRGIILAIGGEFNPTSSSKNHDVDVTASLHALAATGANHVKLIWTWYQDNVVNATTIYPIIPTDDSSSNSTSSSALVSCTISQLQRALTLAQGFGLRVTLCPLVDPNWDMPEVNQRSSGATRSEIGSQFTRADWKKWFASYQSFILPYVAMANSYSSNVDLVEIANGLDKALLQKQEMTDLIASVRKVYTGALTATASSVSLAASSDIGWMWNELDVIGVKVFDSLGDDYLPLGETPTVPLLEAKLEPIMGSISVLSTRHDGKKVIISEIGFQSRPSCHLHPNGTMDRDPMDDSCWLQDHDPSCQANAYEAAMRTFTAADSSSIGGIYWWLWHTDPSSGGQADSDFTPHGKPAEAVLRKYFGGSHDGIIDNDGSAAVASSIKELSQRYIDAAAERRQEDVSDLYNGFCFGGPDEWSSPVYRYNSQGAEEALRSLKDTGANSVEIIVQWYFANISSPVIYPITDKLNPLQTSTDEELASILNFAKIELGMKTFLTLMLDPDWTLPDQNFCRGQNEFYNSSVCYWRGQYGQFWDSSDCSATGEWGQWFAGYQTALVNYAKLSQLHGVDAFILSHELQVAVAVCPSLWEDLTAAVKEVYFGEISHAFQPNVLEPGVAKDLRWIQDLDWIGIDCYLQYPVGDLPTLPWQDLSQQTISDAVATWMPKFAALSKETGKKIVCTEVGWGSRPWTYGGQAGWPKLDPEDCSVWDQCISLDAQALMYEAYMSNFYANAGEWFQGVLFWLWRSDPTAGGSSDDGFSVAGKPSVGVLAKYWL